jgi:hypothetical protein
VTCRLHDGPPGHYVVAREELCATCLEWLDEAARDYQRTHPEGICTPGCGCISHEEMTAKYEVAD